MFKKIMKEIEQEFSVAKAIEYTKGVWNNDRWFTFPKILDGARYCVNVMKSNGLSEVELIEQPADGETLFGNWMSPLAWDVGEATLEIIEPEESAQVLANRREVPCAVIMWSAPTPKEGIEAEVLLLEKGTPEEVEKMDVAGKMLLTDKQPRGIKVAAVQNGAAGIISFYSTHPDDLPDVTMWINGWSDLQGGWMLTKRDTHLVGFSIPPAKGRMLRDIIKNNRKVVVRAKVDSRFYDGILPGATGLIEGTTHKHEEVMVLGHNGEQGANDNASGCGAMLEIGRCLNSLISSGKLPRPKRSIRILMCAECYGSLAYVTANMERMKNTVACINLDTVAGAPYAIGAPLQFVPNPHSNMSYTDVLAEKILASTSTKNHNFVYKTLKNFSMIDNLMTDPMVGSPAHSFYEIGKYWHTSADTPEILDENTIKSSGLFAATYLYFIANAGYKEAQWLAHEVATKGKQRIANEVQSYITRLLTTDIASDESLSQLRDDGKTRINYLLERQIEAVHSVKRLLSEDEVSQISGTLDKLSKQLSQTATDEMRRFEYAIDEYAKTNNLTLVEIKEELTETERKASQIVPKRKFIGTVTYDDLPDELRLKKSSPRWWGELGCALYWCDGKRNLLEIMNLVKLELGNLNADLLSEFEFLAEHGYVSF